ncbi:MAG: hypothetical protein AAF961_18845, partial [Planctomycetota bacterium]
ACGVRVVRDVDNLGDSVTVRQMKASDDSRWETLPRFVAGLLIEANEASGVEDERGIYRKVRPTIGNSAASR